jgi:regulator of replication initiation timing
MSERYAAANYGDDEILSQVQSVNGETIASLRTQLSTVTAQRDAANEEFHATTLDVAHWRTVAECLQVERDRLKKERDAAVEALKQIANELAAIHPYPDNPGLMEWPVTGEADALCLHTAYDTAKAAIAAAGEAP